MNIKRYSFTLLMLFLLISTGIFTQAINKKKESYQILNKYINEYASALKKRNFHKAYKTIKALRNELKNIKSIRIKQVAIMYIKGWSEEFNCFSIMFSTLKKQFNQQKNMYVIISNYKGNEYKGKIHKCSSKYIYMQNLNKKFRKSLRKLSLKNLQDYTPVVGKKGEYYFAVGALHYYQDKTLKAAKLFVKAKNSGYNFPCYRMYLKNTDHVQDDSLKNKNEHNKNLHQKEQIIHTKNHILYVPPNLEFGKSYPLVIALSPSADGKSMVNAWQKVGRRYKWLIYGSNIHRNGISMNSQIAEILKDLKPIYSKFAIARNKVVVTGFSGGGMASHAFAYLFPDFVKVIVPNTGMINRYFYGKKPKSRYPQNKIAVFLASPTDFRYDEMKQDKELLESMGWIVKWIEFQGGHRMASPNINLKAAEWIQNKVFK